MAEDPMLDRLRRALAHKSFTEQKMFDGVCLLLEGNMLVCASKRGLLVRIGKEGHAEALARPHAKPMEMGGREMQGYVFVSEKGTATDSALRKWLDLALAYVETLPAKAGKSAGRGAKAKPRRGTAKRVAS